MANAALPPLWPVSFEAVAYPRRSPAAMAAVWMLPAHPPLPTAKNLPFQFSVGIHNSISIWESGEGFSVAATLQCAGNGCAAGTNSTAVIVVWGNGTDFKLSQGVCWIRAAAARSVSMLVMVWTSGMRIILRALHTKWKGN